MNALAPEFARYWLEGQSTRAFEPASSDEGDQPDTREQAEALEALADRVSAARSVY